MEDSSKILTQHYIERLQCVGALSWLSFSSCLVVLIVGRPFGSNPLLREAFFSLTRPWKHNNPPPEVFGKMHFLDYITCRPVQRNKKKVIYISWEYRIIRNGEHVFFCSNIIRGTALIFWHWLKVFFFSLRISIYSGLCYSLSKGKILRDTFLL